MATTSRTAGGELEAAFRGLALRKIFSATPDRPSETHMRALSAALRSSPRMSQLAVAASCSGASLRVRAPVSSAKRVLFNFEASPSEVILAGLLPGLLAALAGGSLPRAGK